MAVSRKLVWCGAVLMATVGGAAADPPVAPKPLGTEGRPFGALPASDPVRAADPLGVLLADGKVAYARVRDYTCIFTRQERTNGGTISAEQVAEMKVRVQPACVYLRFAKPETAAGLEVAYKSNRPDGKLRYRPAGAKGQNGFLTLTPTDPKIVADFHRPVAELGIGPIFDLLSSSAAREKTLNNPVEVFTEDYQFAGRDVTRYEIYTRRPHSLRYAYRTVVFVDKESKLPVRLEAYDSPKTGGLYGDLLEAYSYSDLKINVGLGDSNFDY